MKNGRPTECGQETLKDYCPQRQIQIAAIRTAHKAMPSTSILSLVIKLPQNACPVGAQQNMALDWGNALTSPLKQLTQNVLLAWDDRTIPCVPSFIRCTPISKIFRVCGNSRSYSFTSLFKLNFPLESCVEIKTNNKEARSQSTGFVTARDHPASQKEDVTAMTTAERRPRFSLTSCKI